MADDYAASTATTGVVSVGGSTTGNIESTADADWFGITLTAGRSYQFDLEASATGQGTLPDPFLELMNSAGTSISYDFDSGAGNNARITFAPSASGTYYLAADAFSSDLGTYKLSATDLGPGGDDYAASTATTGVVSVGGSTTGNIESTQDEDWFRVTLTAGRSYQFDLEASATGQGTLPDPFLELMNSAGTSISYDFDSGAGNNARITFAPSASGTYYLAADAFSSDLGTYKLSATDLGPGGDDYAASTATTGVVSVGGSTTGNIESTGDEDWFRVTLTAGRSYQFDLEASATGKGTLPDPFLELMNSAGTSISYDFDSGAGNNARITFAPSASGTYYLAADAFSSDLGTYKLSATDLGPGGDDYAASTATTGVVSVGGSTTGNIESTGDEDWFRVTLTAGRSYQFDLEASATGKGTLPDPFLELMNSAGTSISYDFDSGAGNNARITFAPSASGTYYLAADAFSSDLGTYKLSATDLGPGGDDYAASTATTGVVSVGGSTTGNIESTGDEDWFRVTLTAGRSYQFDLEASATGKGTLPDPFLELMNSAGTSISYDFDSGAGNNARITFAPSASGTYYLAADAFSSDLGTYKLSATDLGVNQPPVISSNGGGSVATTSIAENATAVATVAATDADGTTPVYSIVNTAGTDFAKFTINATTGALSFNSAPNFEAPTNSGHNNSYVVQVRVSDGSLTDDQLITVNVTSVNDNAPVITSSGGGSAATISIAENAKAAATVAATDADGTTPVYSIVNTAGTDFAKFTINATTGALSFNSAPNFEAPTDSGHNNNYVVQVRGSDGILFDTQTITVIVTDVGGVTPFGDKANNTLIGTPENDTLRGLGGKDTLTGGPGFDAFLFDVKLKKGNVDHLTDFAEGVDKIRLDHDIFKKLDIGDLPSNAFFAHKHADAARDGKDHVVYDTKSGELWYDKDGKGGAHAKLFAILDASPDDLSPSDFLVVA